MNRSEENSKTPPTGTIPDSAKPAKITKEIKTSTFEEWCDKFQRFVIEISLYSMAAILVVSLICGIIYGIAAWQMAK